MIKKLLFGTFGALMLSAGIFTTATLTQKQQISDLTLANIEAMSGGFLDDLFGDDCMSGGRGSSGCSHSGEVAGVGYSCGVDCQSGYYACCHLTCNCKPNK